MIKFESCNELSLKVTFSQPGQFVHTKVGSMIGMQGQNGMKPVKFEKELIGPGGNLVAGIANQMLRRVTGENMPLMKATANGQAEMYLANQGDHVVVLHLRQGESIFVESENLLAFTDDCRYEVAFFGAGIISQGGLAKSKLTCNGPNAIMAVTCHGNPIVLNGVSVCDPDAFIASNVLPSMGMDLNFKNFIGQSSGESYNLQFKDQRSICIIQPFERNSGVSFGMDGGDLGSQASQQQNMGMGDITNGIGGAANGIGDVANRIGRFFN